VLYISVLVHVASYQYAELGGKCAPGEAGWSYGSLLKGELKIPYYRMTPEQNEDDKPRTDEMPYLFDADDGSLFPRDFASRLTMETVIEAMKGKVSDGLTKFSRESKATIDELPVQRSTVGRSFKYYGKSTPLSDSFPLQVTINGTTKWREFKLGARPMEGDAISEVKIPLFLIF